MGRNLWKRIIALLLAVVCLAGCSTLPDATEHTATQVPTVAPATEGSIPSAPQATTVPAQPTTPPAIEVTDPETLLELVSGGALQNGDTVRITQAIEINQQIVIGMPIKLVVEAPILCACPLVFETWETGVIGITVSDGVDAAALDIRLDAPNCDVIWQSAPYETEEMAAKLTNVASLNGVDLREKYGLGGSTDVKLTGFAMLPEDNSALSAPLQWRLEGNVAYLAVSYLISGSTLKNAKVQLTFSDGTAEVCEMDLTEEALRYTLLDADNVRRTYLIETTRITYNLPVFYIEIEDGKEVTSREDYLNATLRIDTDTAAGGYPGLETTNIKIRGRGHYSWNFDKKPYKVRFLEKTSVMGMNASKDWTLIANYTDRSLIQNYVAMEMGKVMDYIPYHSNQIPVDLFVNGEYRGVYTFGEQLQAKKERIDLEESYTDPDTDYLLEVGGSDPGDVNGRDYFHAGTLQFIAIKHPETADLQQAQLDYLINYVKRADQAVRNLDHYEDYIDVDSLIDWVIIHELSYNLDCCFHRSTYLIKEKNGKLKMGPIWDFDLAFGSYYRYQEGDWATVGEVGGYIDVTWMNYLKKDQAFMARFTARWNEVKQELRQTALRCVKEMGALVAPSAEMNFQVWDILGKKIPSQSASHNKYDTYEKMVQRLYDFIEDRYEWMDKELNG